MPYEAGEDCFGWVYEYTTFGDLPVYKRSSNTVLLDVRTKREFEGKADPDFGSLKNAINIPIQELEGRLSELAVYKAKEIIVYCSHSHRSPQASYLLTQNGFTKVVNMSGGMSELADGDCIKK